MLSQTSFFSDRISEILGSIGKTGVLKLSEYDQLTTAVWSDALNEVEKKAVDRVMHFVGRGRIEIVDDIWHKMGPLPLNRLNRFQPQL